MLELDIKPSTLATPDDLSYSKKMKIIWNLNLFSGQILNLVKSPVFITLTLVGNGLIGLAGTIFYYMEKESNPKMLHFIDAIWWSFATATTTGYGDITPVTYPGKVLGILLMLMGTALFAMYTGLFADVILGSAKSHR